MLKFPKLGIKLIKKLQVKILFLNYNYYFNFAKIGFIFNNYLKLIKNNIFNYSFIY